MPRLDHAVPVESLLSYEVRLVLDLLLTEINTLRQQAGLPVRTLPQVQAAVRTWLRTHPRDGRA